MSKKNDHISNRVDQNKVDADFACGGLTRAQLKVANFKIFISVHNFENKMMSETHLLMFKCREEASTRPCPGRILKSCQLIEISHLFFDAYASGSTSNPRLAGANLHGEMGAQPRPVLRNLHGEISTRLPNVYLHEEMATQPLRAHLHGNIAARPVPEQGVRVLQELFTAQLQLVLLLQVWFGRHLPGNLMTGREQL